jgi:hypothetical protein
MKYSLVIQLVCFSLFPVKITLLSASIVKVSIVDLSEKNISEMKITQKKLKDEIEFLKAKLSK